MEHEANQGELDHDPHGDFESDFSDDHRARIKSELEPGERLLWASRSFPSKPAVGCVVYLVIPLIAVLGYLSALLIRGCWISGGFHTIEGRYAAGVAAFWLCLMAMFMFILLITLRNRRRGFVANSDVLYAITDRRLLFWIPMSGGSDLRITSLYRNELKSTSRVEKPDGSGDLCFALNNDISHSDYEAGFWFHRKFRAIPGVRHAERIVRQNLLNSDATQEA